jgi:hypothetical protein
VGSERAILEITLAPQREQFYSGEPVAILMTIHNRGERVLRVPFSYPRALGLTFRCNDKDAVATRIEQAGEIDLPLIALELAPGERKEIAFALNRFVTLSKPKRYKIAFASKHVELGPIKRAHVSSGEFWVEIRAGLLPEHCVAQYSQALKGADNEKLRQGIELLSWVDHPSAIRQLEGASELRPDTGVEVIAALRRRSSDPEAGQAVLRIGAAGEPWVLKESLLASADMRVAIPHAFWRALLSSDSAGKVLVALEFLLTHGDPSHLPLVEPFLTDNRADIAELARKVEVAISASSKSSYSRSSQPWSPGLAVAGGAVLTLLGCAIFFLRRRHARASQAAASAKNSGSGV